MGAVGYGPPALTQPTRSEEHTSELQSLRHLVCRLLLEEKKQRAAPPGAREAALSVTAAGTPVGGASSAKKGQRAADARSRARWSSDAATTIKRCTAAAR